MSQFMLYAHRNTASDNMVRCERKVHKREGSKNTRFPRFILWISRQKVYCLIELELTLNLRVFFFCVFLCFGYKITENREFLPIIWCTPVGQWWYYSTRQEYLTIFNNICVKVIISCVHCVRARSTFYLNGEACKLPTLRCWELASFTVSIEIRARSIKFIQQVICTPINSPLFRFSILADSGMPFGMVARGFGPFRIWPPEVSAKRFRPFSSSAPMYENVSFWQYFLFFFVIPIILAFKSYLIKV